MKREYKITKPINLINRQLKEGSKIGSSKDISIMTLEMIIEDINKNLYKLKQILIHIDYMEWLSIDFKNIMKNKINEIEVEINKEFECALKLQKYVIIMDEYMKNSGKGKDGLKILKDDKMINQIINDAGIIDELSKEEKYILVFSSYRAYIWNKENKRKRKILKKELEDGLE